MKKLPNPGFLVSFLVIVCALFAVYTALDYSRTLAEARNTSNTMLMQSSRTVTAELQRISYGCRQLVGVIDTCNQDGILSFLEPVSVNRITVPFLRNDPSITSLNYGNDRGDGYLVLQNGSLFRNRIKQSRVPGRVTWFDCDQNGHITGHSTVADDYDPRQRPWYVEAHKGQGLAWGVPYVFRTTRELGVTASATLSPRPGMPLEVVGIDIKLKDLSLFLSNISLQEHASIDLVGEKGFVFASSRYAVIERRLAATDATPPRIDDREFALQKAIIQKHLKGNSEQFEVSLDGSSYFVHISPFPLGNGRTVFIILTLPREEMMAGFLATFYHNLVMFLLFLGVMTSYFLFRFIVPLRSVTRYARDFSLDASPKPLPVTRRDEVGILSGSINGMVEEVRQKTMALRLSEEHYRTLVESAMSIILRWDTNGVITFINEHGAGIFGYRAEELVGRHVIGTIVPPSDSAGRDLKAMIDDICRTPDSYRSNQNENITRDGRTLWINWSNVSVRDQQDRSVEILSIGNDVTPQVEAERQVRRLNDELERRVRERTAAFEASNRELEAFCYSVSHDLRAPLRHINAYANIFMEDHGNEVSGEGQEILQHIARAAERMGTLIDDLLDLSRVSRQELVIGSVNLSALAREVAEELARGDSMRQVRVSIADGVMVHGDETLLRVVLTNLLGNAWKYTSKTPDAAISFSTEPSADGLVFFVRDNGAGFDMQYSHRLFKPFERLHGVDEFEGTGIGLAIVERVISRHGGTIWADSRPGEGATFFCRLPAIL